MTTRTVLLMAIVGLVTACSTSLAGRDTTTSATANTPTVTAAASDPLDGTLPAEARESVGGGDPRPVAYWLEWNTCAAGNQAAVAEQNGGAAAGWYLLDDVLADPGIGLGDHVLGTCEEAVALLGGGTAVGEETAEPAFALAAELIAAEANLNVGAESCPAAEEAVIGAHLVLASGGFDGVSISPLDAEAAGALPRLIDLLGTYNAGDLCR